MREESIGAYILEPITDEETLIIYNDLYEFANDCGISVHECSFIGTLKGCLRWRPGEKPVITLESKLSIKYKAWVLAHELGHLFTIDGVIAGKPNVDLIFGEDKDLITKVEEAADEWAEGLIMGEIRRFCTTGEIRSVRRLDQTPKRVTTQVAQ